MAAGTSRLWCALRKRAESRPNGDETDDKASVGRSGAGATARPAQAAFGHPGHHLTCTSQPDGQWHLLFSNGIPPETTAALRQLAEEIIVELMGHNDELKDEVAREVKKKKDDEDRTNRKLRQMGFKTPQSSSMVK